MTKKVEPKKFRHFCGTSYENYDDEFFEKLRGVARYYCFGKESCPSSGRDHFQWYIYLRTQKSEKAMRDYMAPAHVEICGGTPQQNITYCSKNNDTIEWGLAPHQGARKDLDDARRSAANGMILDVIDHGNYQAIKVAEKWLEYNSKKRDPNVPVHVTWIWGPPGCGKSRLAYERWPEAYRKMPGKWWDGYASEDAVIFDDFDPTDYTEKQILTWWDRYPCRVEVKGGTRQLAATHFIITSILHPNSVWNNGGQFEAQFHRRITDIIDCSKDGCSEVNG